jgi:succinate dehydrogenase / fumarate reductase cytochrome b subunit
MALSRDVSLKDALRYQGKGPMLTFILHRISGLSIVLFVGLHIIGAFLSQQFGSEVGTVINAIYENWLFQIYIISCGLFHAINGLRIVILDLWPKLIEYQREAIWLEWFVFLPIFVMTVFIIIRTALAG